MLKKPYVVTVAGGLILMLVTASCASKPSTRTTANPPPKDGTVASDRTAVNSDGTRMASTDQKAEQGRLTTEPSNQRPVTERPVPSERTGSGDPMATNQAVPCADERADMTAPFNCVPREHTSYAPEALATCPHRTDADGHIIFQDQACARRYRVQDRVQMGSSFENVDYSRESAYFDRYMDKAVKQAREAEIAANQGHAPEMLRHAELALDQAKEAQRAGNVPGLREGISELRQTLRHGQMANWVDAGDHVRLARMNLAQAAGMKPNDLRLTAGTFATKTSTSSMAGQKVRTVKGELIGDEAAPRTDGNRQYMLRDQEGKETQILLTPDMNKDVHAGDKVLAELDPEGRVVAINKE